MQTKFTINYVLPRKRSHGAIKGKKTIMVFPHQTCENMREMCKGLPSSSGTVNNDFLSAKGFLKNIGNFITS